MAFRIVTWNVNSVKARLDRVVNYLKLNQPDVLCLQELKGMEDKFPYEEMKAAGYQSAVFGQKTYNGVAILAKTTPEEVHRGMEGFEDPAARLISARVAGIHIISAYVPNGQEVGSEKYEYKLKWLSALRKHLDFRYGADEPIVLVGDFNVAPEDRDVHDPELWRGKILFSDAEKKALAKVFDFGLEDTFRKHFPQAGYYSWWDYRQLGFPKNRGLRIDFVLASKALGLKCSAAGIDREERKGQKPSDHAPVFADFKI